MMITGYLQLRTSPLQSKRMQPSAAIGSDLLRPPWGSSNAVFLRPKCFHLAWPLVIEHDLKDKLTPAMATVLAC